MNNQLRIIAGNWRSRVISFPDAAGLRPTSDRVRETLFNWLQHDIPGRRCLDLFAGSGALGFEAASRGAASVVMIEKNALVYQALCDNSRQLEANTVEVIQTTAQRFLNSAPEAFDLVFLDPPFSQNQLPQDCQQLEAVGCLKANAKIYIEATAHEPLNDLPASWHSIRSKQAGNVAYHLFHRD